MTSEERWLSPEEQWRRALAAAGSVVIIEPGVAAAITISVPASPPTTGAPAPGRAPDRTDER